MGAGGWSLFQKLLTTLREVASRVHCCATAVPLPGRATALPLLCHCCVTAFPLLCHCRSIALTSRCVAHWPQVGDAHGDAPIAAVAYR